MTRSASTCAVAWASSALVVVDGQVVVRPVRIGPANVARLVVKKPKMASRLKIDDAELLPSRRRLRQPGRRRIIIIIMQCRMFDHSYHIITGSEQNRQCTRITPGTPRRSSCPGIVDHEHACASVLAQHPMHHI